MFSNKINDITPSYTIGISSKIKELINQGLEIIDLSIGEPDFPTPFAAKEKAVEAVHSNKTKYGLVSGLFELREAIQSKLKLENNITYEINDIVVSSGAKHAITNALITLLNFGDEVIIPKPYWVSYPEMVKLVGGTPIFIDTSIENNFKVTASDIEKAITSRTKLIFISNPSNPTGAIYSKEEIESIVNVCIHNKIYILSDEIYERISYVDNFTSIASISDEAKEITVTINGLSKSASMTGWRIGYTATNPALAKAISTVQGHLVSHPSTISQWAAVSALTQCSDETKKMVHAYKARRDAAVKALSKIKGISFIYPEGAFYFFINVSSFKKKIFWDKSFSIAFTDALLNEEKVAVVPGIAFGMDDYIRISFACRTDSLMEGINRMQNFIEK